MSIYHSHEDSIKIRPSYVLIGPRAIAETRRPRNKPRTKQIQPKRHIWR
jgi:hypothetical protein